MIAKDNGGWENIGACGFEEGTRVSGIATAIRVMAGTAQEWGNELGMIVCSLDVKQAFDKVTSESVRQAMEELGINLVSAQGHDASLCRCQFSQLCIFATALNLLLGAMHDWESRNLEIKGTPNWVQREVNLEVFVPISK